MNMLSIQGPARSAVVGVAALLLFCAHAWALDYYWTGAGAVTPHDNRDWATVGNWAIGSAGSGVVPASGPSELDNVFLISSNAYLGGYYVAPASAPVSTQVINNLTIVSGSNNIGSRYTSGAVDLVVNGNFEILAGSFYGGPYSPNWIQFKGGFTAASGTTLGNNGSTSDGGYWDLRGATSIVLNGTTLNQMTNNWQYGPQVWNFGDEGTSVAIQLTNNNTFNLVQDVMTPPRTGIASRGSQQITIYNPITGLGGITKTGDATLILAQTSSNYAGATNINQGILIARGGNAIGDLSSVSLANYQGGENGGSVKATLVLEGNETIGSLAGGGVNGGNVILNGNTLTMGGNNAATTFAGIIGGSASGAQQGVLNNQGDPPPSYTPSTPVGYVYAPIPEVGAGNVVKTGTGTMTLTGVNLYTGTTTLHQGTLTITGEVKKGVAGALGQAASAVIFGDANTPDSSNGDSGSVTLIVENRSNDSVNWVFERDLDASALRSNLVGRPRFMFYATNVSDTSTLTLSGNVAFSTGTTGRYEMVAQRAGSTLNVTGKISGSGNVLLWNGSNLGLGTIRVSNAASDYDLRNKVVRGTLVVAGDVAATGASPIGMGAMDLGGDGAPFAVNVAGGINTKPGLFMETAGTTFARAVNLGTVATYATNGVTNNGVANGYRLGGLNTTGTVTFSGNVNSPTTGNGLANLALFAQGGGTVVFSGVINDNPNEAQVTRVTINQFVNHPDLNATDGGADQGVGAATTGTVILSGPNTYMGLTDVRAGTLLANNLTGSATGTGSVVVRDGAKLGGTGSLSGGTAGSITLGAGSQLMIGAGHGVGGGAQDLVLGNSTAVNNVAINLHGSLQFDIFGAGSLAALGDSSYHSIGTANDLLEIFTTGNINLDGAVVQLSALDTSGWLIGHSWKLIDWSNAAYLGLSTQALTLGTTAIDGFELSQTIRTDGYYVTVTAVPEPARGLLMVLGAAMVVGCRRCRLRKGPADWNEV
jgi:fibronectin-binding autotransporter adhesin